MTPRFITQGGTRNGATHRPYRPTTLHSARATAAYQRWLPILIMAAIVAAFLSLGASA